MNVYDIVNYFETLGEPKREEGLLLGDRNKEIINVLVCWMADVDAIKFAADNGCQMIIAHEAYLYNNMMTINIDSPHVFSWKANNNRIKLLSAYDIALFRSHYTLDKYCILDSFTVKLGLNEPIVQKPEFVNIYKIDDIRYQNLIYKVKNSLGLDTIRATKVNPDRIIRTVGVPWGGMSLVVNVGYMEQLIQEGCDCFIAGESDSYAFRYAVDSGVEMIETGHETSENPGLKHMTDVLNKTFTETTFMFYDNGTAFKFF